MLQPGRDLDLAQEALRAHRGGQLRAKNLDRDVAVVLEIVGQIDVAMPPRPSSRPRA